MQPEERLAGGNEVADEVGELDDAAGPLGLARQGVEMDSQDNRRFALVRNLPRRRAERRGGR
jgi:hypothetical protein